MAASLHSLTHKNREFLWATEYQQASKTLKSFLHASPILAFPDTSANVGEFGLDMDTGRRLFKFCLKEHNTGARHSLC